MPTNEEMRAWLEEKIRHSEKFIKAYPGSIDIKKARKDMEMMQAILAVLEKKSPNENLIQAVKDYLEWGAMTGSDRDLHESKFLKALAALGVEVSDGD